ncbi:hypothetical protein DXG03_000467 [Asterophora parasitica]|uniref:PAS domain-containing protein n=1 Tax=Asterophora parasitica TaxID=117018 RepID=A0A9P7GI15_9AGAR|nr:hypothetical protein DXG03_000467 [Asterophora parasitica]
MALTAPHDAHASFTTDDHPAALPKLGGTRCYWALLSSELQFIYLDPVLQSHLEAQAELLVGKSLLSFVHPDEVASAKIDLGGVLESRTLHGSVTRVRFSRLSRVRRQLGHEGPTAFWSDADKIALDSNYMAVDIVINWAAEGLVLCFIHAIVDLTPSDNDEHNKTGWTNWCGTPLMDDAQIDTLYGRLLVCAQRPSTPNRVFQILANREGRPLLLSWPPDQGQGTQRPNARDFAHLVENAQIGNSGTAAAGAQQEGNEAKTSCTRRYKAFQTMPALGSEVESIFIPHGACLSHLTSTILPSSDFRPSFPAPKSVFRVHLTHINTQAPSYSPVTRSTLPPPAAHTQTQTPTQIQPQIQRIPQIIPEILRRPPPQA